MQLARLKPLAEAFDKAQEELNKAAARKADLEAKQAQLTRELTGCKHSIHSAEAAYRNARLSTLAGESANADRTQLVALERQRDIIQEDLGIVTEGIAESDKTIARLSDALRSAKYELGRAAEHLLIQELGTHARAIYHDIIEPIWKLRLLSKIRGEPYSTDHPSGANIVPLGDNGWRIHTGTTTPPPTATRAEDAMEWFEEFLASVRTAEGDGFGSLHAAGGDEEQPECASAEEIAESKTALSFNPWVGPPVQEEAVATPPRD